MDFRIIKKDCKEISYAVADNGLMDITAPSDCDNSGISAFFNSLGQAKIDEIADKQKKYKEKFRKKLHKQIEEYADEFKLPFIIDLQLRNKTKKLNDSHVEVYGISFEGKMQLAAVLQYLPEDIVDGIVRFSVYDMAIDFENVCSRITGVKVGTFQYPDVENAKEEHYGKPDEAKYQISMPHDQIKKIQADYQNAVKQFMAEMEKNPILSLG